MNRTRLLITGGTGFIGGGLCSDERFKDALHIGRSMPLNQKNFVKKTLVAGEDLGDVLTNTDTIIHSAGIAHAIKNSAKSSSEEIEKVNIDYPIYLAQQAIYYGVKRFVFISSIKVLGEITTNGRKFKYDDKYYPEDEYALSKVIAEKELLKLADSSNLELVIVRVPLVIGKNTKGNLKRFSDIARRGIPLPLGGIKDLRSIVSLENLVDLIWHCSNDKRAANKIVMVKDKYDLSTSDLFRRLAQFEGYRLRLFWIPKFFLKFIFSLLARRDLISKMLNSSQIDIDFTKNDIGWSPK